MRTKIILIFSIIIFLNGCDTLPVYEAVASQKEFYKSEELSEIDKKSWFLKDIIDDSIPGISLDKAFNTVLKNKKGKEVIIAVIDTEVDINHENLKNKIWINNDEIANNNIDDDKNGYIDDVNGWNFIGNSEGENIFYANFEITRIVRFYNEQISKSNVKDTLTLLGESNYKLYKRALKKLNFDISQSSALLKRVPYITENYLSSFKKVKHIANDSTFTIRLLDSLKIIHKDIEKDINLIKQYKNFGIHSVSDIEKDARFHKNKIDKYLNINYNEREILADNPNVLTHKYYGNNKVSNNINKLYHGTYVAGVLASVINDKIKLMPLCVSANGDEHDKDISLAIRYAVDNGAQVINISSGKDYSLHEKWVLDAIQYAESNNVLIITSAGNDGKNLDKKMIYNYPNDVNKENQEIVSNFLKVGSSSEHTSNKLFNSTSNFGKTQVDIFAPGENIFTASSIDKDVKYEFRSGTSYAAPIVSGIAGLIFSYYPNLSAAEIKQIIMNSGVEYTGYLKVSKKDSISFNELSKSGKIINAYNAIIMAKTLSN